MARWSDLLPTGRTKLLLFFGVLVFLLLAAPLAVLADTVRPQSAPATSITASAAVTDADWGRMPLYFIANQGQVDSPVAFYVSGRDKTLYFTAEGLTLALSQATSTGAPGNSWAVKLDHLGANAVVPRGVDSTGMVVSYLSGTPDSQHTGLPTYSSIVYPGVWQGVDVVYSGSQDQLKQEFVLASGADPSCIRLAYRGADVTLNDKDDLVVSTPVGTFTDAAPFAYQEVGGERVSVPARFVLGSTSGKGAEAVAEYGFRLGVYDPTLPLVIDPAVLIYCGYLGGSGQERGSGIAVDAEGCAYVTGETRSAQFSFPVAVGPDLTFNGYQTYGTDAFVAKVKADGTGLVYCGYIGGGSFDEGTDIAVDASGNAYVTGETQSSEATFPVTVGPDLARSSAEQHAFVAKIDATGTALTYCGYLQDNRASGGSGIDVDSSGCAYITGYGFLDKVEVDGTGLVYSYDLGGWDVAVDTDGCAYLTGFTIETEATFPVAVGPDSHFQRPGGTWD